MLLRALLFHPYKTRAHYRLVSRCIHHHLSSLTAAVNSTWYIKPVLPTCTVSNSVIPLKIHANRCLANEAFQGDDTSDDEDEFSDDLKEVEDANIRCLGSILIKKEHRQWGVHTTRQFARGELVISSKLNDDQDTALSSTSCAHSIQIDWNKHILMNLPARYLNHSCDPNIGVGGLNADGSYDFVALVDIDCDQELRFDYETTEYEIGAFTKCYCGSPHCRGKIAGYKYSGQMIHEKYSRENIASYLLE